MCVCSCFQTQAGFSLTLSHFIVLISGSGRQTDLCWMSITSHLLTFHWQKASYRATQSSMQESFLVKRAAKPYGWHPRPRKGWKHETVTLIYSNGDSGIHILTVRREDWSTLYFLWRLNINRLSSTKKSQILNEFVVKGLSHYAF